jgi:hypothetical protein
MPALSTLSTGGQWVELANETLSHVWRHLPG